LYNVYYPEDIAKELIGVVFHKDKFYQFFHSSTTGNSYLGVLLKEANQYEFQDDVSTEDKEDKGAEEQLTLQIRNSLVTIDQGQPESPERTREPWAPDRMPTIASTTTLTPTTYSILLSRHNRDYQWPQKLLHEPSQRVPHNTRSLSNWPNHLMDPEEMEDPFLSELTGLAPVDLQKGKSVLLSLMPSEDASDPDEQEAEKAEEDLLMTTTMEELPTKSPMATTSRIWSPSPRPTTSKLWGHTPESSMEIGPGPRPSSPSSSDTSYSTKELQDSSLLFNKLH
jgi:hypothetical protein